MSHRLGPEPHDHHHDGRQDHAGAGHAHGHLPGEAHTHGASETRIGIAAILTGLFMLAEVAGGLVSGSLALLADAGHMLTDFVGLALAWLGFRLARRPADWKRTYGYDRFSVLAAFTNGIALFAIAAWIAVEATSRLQQAQPVLGGPMALIAALGLAVNVAAFFILQGGNRTDLNMRAATLHVMGDLLGSVGALLAALIIMTTGWTPIDPILSVAVALIILHSAWAVVRESGHILLEGAPAGYDSRTIASDLAASVSGVAGVHHVHVWSISQKRPMATLHAELTEGASAAATRAAIKQRLAERFGIAHATVETEHGSCSDSGTPAGCSDADCGGGRT